MDEYHQTLSQQAGAMWTSTNLFDALNQVDEFPPIEENAPQLNAPLQQPNNASGISSCDQQLQTISMHADAFHQSTDMHMIAASDGPEMTMHHSATELTQSEINDILFNLATKPETDKSNVGNDDDGESDQQQQPVAMFSISDVSGELVSLSQQYMDDSPDGLEEYLRLTSGVQSCGGLNKTSLKHVFCL